MKNLFKDLDTKTLKWMDYKWEHCNEEENKKA